MPNPRTTTTNTRQDYLEQQKVPGQGFTAMAKDERPWRARGGYGGVKVLTFDGCAGQKEGFGDAAAECRNEMKGYTCQSYCAS